MSSTPQSNVSETLPDDVAEALARSLMPIELSAEQRNRMRAGVLQQARDATSEGTATARTDARSWIKIAPFIEIKILRRDESAGNQTLLIRMQPGGVIPEHRHSQEEEFVVLEGECHVGAHRLCAGDVHIASAGSSHGPVTTRTGVVALLRGEYPAPCDSKSSAGERP